MEELLKTMARKVDREEIVGYLASYCTKGLADDYQIITSARVADSFSSPYRLYVPLLGKLFHTISKGHPEPEKLIQRIIVEAHKEFKEALKDESQESGEYTVIGKL
ncbi:MAG: hypothetical protein PVJ11_10520 [Syntrophobacterales bacterium]|jgi:hypothetical protein